MIINGRTQEKVEAAINALQQEIEGATVSGIVADFAEVEAVTALLGRLPDIDILVNNIGIFELKSFTDIEDTEWYRIFEINVMSGIRLSRALLPKMLKRNQGRVIFVSSEAAVNTPEHMIHYGMTKTAMLALSRGLAQMTKNTEVTVNTILGGPTYSEGVAATITQLAATQDKSVGQVKQDLMQALNPTSLLQRFITPSEIAAMVAYLASPWSAATNGAAIRVDGGVLNTIL